MRLGLIYRHFKSDGGTGRYGVVLAKGLLEHAHELDLICESLEPDPTLEAHALAGRLRVHRVRLPPLPTTLRDLYFAHRVRSLRRRIEPDLCVALGRVPGAEVFRAGGGCHEVWMESLPWAFLSPWQRLELSADRSCARRARVVVANAPMPGRQIVERYGVSEDRVEVVPNGVDASRFRPDADIRARVRAELGLDSRSSVVLFLGSGFWRKGLDRAIETIQRRPDACLLVVGKDKREGAWRRMARDRGVEALFLGARKDPERLLAASDAMLLPTRYDAASNAVLEAMAAGVPAVTTTSNGAAAFVPDASLAVGPPFTPEAFVLALDHALGEPGLGARCRERALEMSWSRSVEGMLRVIERAADLPRDLAPARRSP
jgi:UDP-glucose:(heptosyl)LPS alpha-1,3-glucosyltransferase